MLRCTMRNVNSSSLRAHVEDREFEGNWDPVQGVRSSEIRLQIGDQIVAVLEPDGDPQKVGRNARLLSVLRAACRDGSWSRACRSRVENPPKEGARLISLRARDEAVGRGLSANELEAQHESWSGLLRCNNLMVAEKYPKPGNGSPRPPRECRAKRQFGSRWLPVGRSLAEGSSDPRTICAESCAEPLRPAAFDHHSSSSTKPGSFANTAPPNRSAWPLRILVVE